MRLALLIAVAAALDGQRVREASGVVRVGEETLIADDSLTGAYVELETKRLRGPFFRLNDYDPERKRLHYRGLGVDFESVDMLADGRVALLSERLRSLVGDRGVIAEYDSELAETGKRGLEGLAVRPLPDGASRVAVLWEGGYPDYGALGRARDQGPWQPLVVVHDIPRNGRAGRVRMAQATLIELKPPLPDHADPPRSQRFRAPDLVWYPDAASRDGWGFLVLLSSQDGSPRPEFRHKWLQRFRRDGSAFGAPLDLMALLPPSLRAGNWEGLAWWEPGRSVILVCEEDGNIEAHGWILELPEELRKDPAAFR
ncbi:MAG: hypothetical protein R2729_28680 [Bryobacteraceae bacterium]